MRMSIKGMTKPLILGFGIALIYDLGKKVMPSLFV